jgi:transcriptional regulator with XRE-family HTH domain
LDAEEARTIGARLRRIRRARGKSLRVVAELAGMSKSHLDRIERGERALDSISEIVALANALQIAPSELLKLPVPAPANGHTDSTINAIALALDAIEVEHPDGLVLSAAVLRDRVTRFHQQKRACRLADVAAELPGLVRDVHTTLATGTDHGDLLELAVYLHVHITRQWLVHAAAPEDLLRRVVFLARRLAQEHGEVTTLGMAGFAVADTLLASGEFELAKTALDSLTLPPTTAANAGLVGVLTTSHAAAAELSGRAGDAAAAMSAAADMAIRFGELGETDPLGFEFGPTNVGFRQVRLALEAGEPDRAVSIAERLHPNQNPFPCNRVYHWVGYGRGLARLRGRQEDAVRTLRRAETIYPLRVQRDPFVREVLGELTNRPSHDVALRRELHGMAYRAGLLV